MFSPINTDHLVLRGLASSDAETMFGYRSNPEVSRYQNWEPKLVEEIRSFIESLADAENVPGKWFQVGIVLRETGKLIGDFGLHVSEADPRQVEIGITLAPSFQGKGLASEALRAMLEYLFSKLGMHRVFGSVDPRNSASMELLNRLGMRQEAHFVESYWSRGEWTDDVIFAILKREWEEAHPSMKLGMITK